MITIARADQLELLDRQLERARALVSTITKIDVAAAIARVPVLRQDYVAGAFIEPDSKEVDVHGLHQGFLRTARTRGARIVVNAEVLTIERNRGCWCVTTPAGAFCAPTLLNAAGAWADSVAERAGVRPLGLMPMRRTAFNIPAPLGIDIRGWPLVNDVAEEFYFKPDAGQLFVSPADATPSAPVDAYPDDLDVAPPLGPTVPRCLCGRDDSVRGGDRGTSILEGGHLHRPESARSTHAAARPTLRTRFASKLLRTLALPSPKGPNLAFSPDEKTIYVMALDQIDKSPYRGKVYSMPNE